jgi:aldose 1-epimerase
MTQPPSGEQVEIAHDDQRAVVVEVGGGLRSYAAGDRDVLDGYGPDEMCLSGRGQVLMPWPNRLEDGSYRFDGRDHQLPLTEPANRNAIHGLVRWASWRIGERDSARVVMEHVIRPQPGYPFTVGLAIEYAVSDLGLSVRSTATNLGETRCPFGAGAHPYLKLDAPSVDVLSLHVPAATVSHSGERSLPNGSTAVDGSEFDFRRPRKVGPLKLDNCFSDLQRDGDGRVRVAIHDPSGRSVIVWAGEGYDYLMVFSGDPLPDVARRSIAVEPMTCPPNAFRSGESVITLEPGAAFTAEWGIECI